MWSELYIWPSITAISLLLVVISYLLRLISLMPTASLTRINKFLPTRWVIYFIKTITRRSYQVPVNTVQSRHNRQVWSASLLNSYNPIFLQLRTMPRLACGPVRWYVRSVEMSYKNLLYDIWYRHRTKWLLTPQTAQPASLASYVF